MGHSRFVRADHAVLKLSNGDTLTVRKRLSQGERTAAYQRIYITGDDGAMRANPLLIGIAMVASYLIDWSLVGLDGQHASIRGLSFDEVTSMLNALDPEDFAEIKAAIDTHEERMLEERAAEKKSLAGVSADSIASPLPAA